MLSAPAWAPASPYLLDKSGLSVDLSTGGLQITGDDLAACIDANGDIHFDMGMVANIDCPTLNGPYWLYSGTSPDGVFENRRYVRFSDTGQSFVMKQRGSDLTSVTGNTSCDSSYESEGWFRSGDFLRMLGWYKPSKGIWGMRFGVNGCEGTGETGSKINVCRGTTTGGALAALTTLWLGSNAGSATGAFPATLKYFRAWRPNHFEDLPAVRVVYSHDSTGHAYATGAPLGFASAVPSCIMTPAEAMASAWHIADISRPGETIAEQDATFTSSRYYRDPGVKVIIMAPSINDLLGGRSGDAMATDYTTQIADRKAKNPGVKIAACTPTPCRGGLSGAQYTQWLAFVANVRGVGTNNVVGADAIIDYAATALNDGSDNLATAYKATTTETIHHNTLASLVLGALCRTQLDAWGYGTG